MSKNTQLGNLVNGIFVDSTGNVGIGTSSPSGKLNLTGGSSGADLLFLNTSGANTNFAFKITGAASDYLTIRRNHSSGGNLDIMSFTYGGNVGIGTSSPLTNLTIGDSATQQQPYISLARTATGGYWAGLRWYDGATVKSYIQEDSDYMLRFGTANTLRMVINASGNVGIGASTTPTYLLEVSTAGGSQRIRVGTLQNNNNSATFEAITTANNTTASAAFFRANAGGSATIGVTTYTKAGGDSGNFANLSNQANTVSIQLASNGNVMVGTETDNGYKLNVSGSIYSSSSIVSNGSMYAVGGIGSQGNVVTDYGYGFGLNSNTQNAANAWNFYVSSSFSNNFRFFYGGTGIGSGSAKFQIDTGGGYTGLSDINKKKDIALSTLGLAEIMQLKPSTFKFKDDENQEEQIGFIAQEVKDIIPYAYYEDKEGDDKFIGLKQAAFIPVLVKAIQELKAEIETLKNK